MPDIDIPFITFKDGDALTDWPMITQAILEGHKAPKAQIADSFLYRGDDTLLSRAAWIDGMGVGVKCATVLPGNPAKGTPMINGAMMLFEDETGTLEALIDFHLVTKWKTAGDSLLGAQLLARPESRHLLIIGAGTVARSLVRAYSSHFPDLDIKVWSRTTASSEAIVTDLSAEFTISVAKDLEAAVGQADIICTATMATDPVLMGTWLKPGQHLDLIGAYRPDMREVDDTAIKKARIFVDSHETTVAHIGELMMPIKSGVIEVADILGDLYDLANGAPRRETEDEITLFKNGGGAHLDLMTAKAILKAWQSR